MVRFPFGTGYFWNSALCLVWIFESVSLFSLVFVTCILLLIYAVTKPAIIAAVLSRSATFVDSLLNGAFTELKRIICLYY